MAVAVENGKMFEMKNPNVDMKEVNRVAEESKATIIRAASPFFENVRVFNKTKRCHVDVSFTNGHVVIAVTNPDDEKFDLNELENPVTAK